MVILGLLAMALVLIGRTTGSGWTMVIVSGLAGVAVAAFLWPGVSLNRVTVRVTAPRDAVAGRPMELEIEVGGGRSLLTVEPKLAYRRGMLQDTGATVMVECPDRGGLVCTPERRGLIESVELDLRGAAPLGLSWWRKSVEVPVVPPVEVAPLATEANLPSIASGEGGDRHRPERRSGHDSVRTVRDYVPGDPTRLVHWGLTARRDMVTVKELEDPEGAFIAVVADLRGDPDLAEKTASRAAGLCGLALRGGMEVVLCTAEESGPVAGRVSSPVAAGRRLARAVAGTPADPPRGSRAVKLP
jgi:uncharacterized protein (DUF58 family)